jgi:MFS family permease
VAKAENIDPTSETLNDKASGIYNGFYSLGSISAPIIGGALTDSIGYRSANDIMAFFALAFFLIYAITNTRPKHYKCKD